MSGLVLCAVHCDVIWLPFGVNASSVTFPSAPLSLAGPIKVVPFGGHKIANKTGALTSRGSA